MAVQAEAVTAAREHRERHGPAILREYAGLLAVPNVARDLDAVRRNAKALQQRFAARGVALDVVTLDGAAPLLTGALTVPGATRTLGLYVHYDGQPADPGAWSSPPFTPTLRTAALEDGGVPLPLPADGEHIDPEWRLYARSAADDKAPFAALLAALDALGKAGITPTSNIVFCFEGEEEIGSPHLGDYVDALADRLQADLWLLCDGPVHQSGRPQIVYGARGFCGLEVTVYGPARELHSGHYGNWAPNPAMALARLLASMKDDDGRVLVDGFPIAGVTEADRASLAVVPDVEDGLRRALGLAATDAAGTPLFEGVLGSSLNVRGLRAAGVGEEARNVVPAEATASIDIRLAAGQDPASVVALVEAHIARQGFSVVREPPDRATRLAHPRIARVAYEEGYPGVRTPLDLPLASAVTAAATTAAGGDVVRLPTLGGSVPLHRFTDGLGAPVLIVPIANHDNNQHAPDENLRIGNLWYGVDLLAALLTMP